MRALSIVKAVQYGAFSRVRELVEAGYNVNQRDSESVTLLHWAAINNRKNIIKFFIEKGAEVNAIGGTLDATPLHWATLKGHLYAVVLLMGAGADPTLREANGCSCIHVAARFGHNALVAYFVARGVSPDLADRGGVTPLMWSCRRFNALDPTRLLLTLGASTGLTDNKRGNTALHWAIRARNSTAITTLILKAQASLDIPNRRGDTPLSMLQNYLGERWIRPKVVEKVREHISSNRFRNFLRRMAKNKRVRGWCEVGTLFLTFYVASLILEENILVLLKIFLLTFLSIVLYCAARDAYDDRFLVTNLFVLASSPF